MVVWLLALASVAAIAVITPAEDRLAWMGLTAAGCTVVTLCIQIATRRKEGYVNRVTASLVGAVVVLAAATGIFALASLG